MRDIILNNFWWKVTALCLAVLAWLGIQPRDLRPNFFPGPYFTRHLISHPIAISKQATDSREFKIAPSEADITLSGDEKILRGLAASEVRATVEIVEYREGTNSLTLHVYVPPGIKIERRTPERVQVELIKQ